MNLPPLPFAYATFDGEGQYDFREFDPDDDYKSDWERRNPNHKGWVTSLYTAEQLHQAQRDAVAAYKAELSQKYEANTERATEAEGEAFTHGYFCGEREAIAEDHAQWAEYLKDGQTPFERFIQERKDLDALMGLYQKAVAAAVPEVTDEMIHAAILAASFKVTNESIKDMRAALNAAMLAAAPEVTP